MQLVDLLREIPIINNRKELAKYIPSTVVLEDYLVDKQLYKGFQTQMYNLLKGCFVIQACREYPVKFKIHANDKKSHKLEFRHFVINIFLWYPFVELRGDLEDLDESFILNKEPGIDGLTPYINDKIIEVLRDNHVKSTKINKAVSEVLHNLSNVSIDFADIMGLAFSAQTFIDLYNEHDEMREIMNCTFDDGMQPHQIEEKLSEYQNREVKFLKSLQDNPLGIILRSNTGIKHKQLAEFTIAEGMKPTLTGETIPKPIETSTMIGGLSTASSLYIDGMGARKSSVMNKKVMGKAGYFGKIVLLLARTLSMSTRVSDCGTENLVNYHVTNEKILRKLNGKFYRLDEYEDLRILDGFRDTFLIGKTIQVRSVATCACGGDMCCTKCVGATAITNYDIADGIAAFESEEVSKVINQSILSTKHLLSTNSEVIEFNPEFYKFFKLNGSEINPVVNNNELVPDIQKYGIFIDPKDMSKVEEMDEDSLFNTQIYNGRFYIRNIEDPEELDLEIKIKGEKEIYIDNDFLEMITKSKDGVVKFSDLNDDVKLFELTIENMELTKPLYQLMDLLNKERKDEEVETIDSISNKFMSLLVEAGIDANIVAAEMIINRLIRSSDDIMERPNFLDPYLSPNDYTIVTVSKALEKNPSPLIGMAFQNIKRQMLSEEFFTKRRKTSYIDAFFKRNIPTDNLKKYSRKMMERSSDDE